MQYLGVLRGSGVLAFGDESFGRVDFDIDGYLTKQGEVLGSGEIRMPPERLEHAFGRSGLKLTTDDGRVLTVRFSAKRHDPASGAEHADIGGELPEAKAWRRSQRDEDEDEE